MINIKKRYAFYQKKIMEYEDKIKALRLICPHNWIPYYNGNTDNGWDKVKITYFTLYKCELCDERKTVEQ